MVYFVAAMKRTNNKSPLLLSSNLQRIFGYKNWQSQWEFFILARKWPEVAGRDVAAQTSPAYTRKDVLWVYVRSSVWMQHMQTLKPGLLEQVRRVLPQAEITDIRWLMEPVERRPEEERRARPVDRRLDPEQQEAFEESATTVKDKRCREALCRLWQVFQQKSG
ncbi:hypothetical protein MNBD_DELTA04-1437 [hydrothermal vent metagenome]|uniref:Zn-ribbon-containing, possibly RNA-binding protein and truncated derivatives n=1 Tax=hydrothermal vent metagenome TaxID=652676 RepID=A0A3B0V109_9ZZZZ